jgi:hypothetical protein
VRIWTLKAGMLHRTIFATIPAFGIGRVFLRMFKTLRFVQASPGSMEYQAVRSRSHHLHGPESVPN